MTRDQTAADITRAIGATHSAYWTACDAGNRAIDPAALDAPECLEIANSEYWTA